MIPILHSYKTPRLCIWSYPCSSTNKTITVKDDDISTKIPNLEHQHYLVYDQFYLTSIILIFICIGVGLGLAEVGGLGRRGQS